MKKAKDLIALRLRCLLNKDFTFDQTVEDFYNDLSESKVFNRNSFMIGFVVGGIVGLLILNHLIK
jgi:hypothetical protein